MRTRVREIGACVIARSERLNGWLARAAIYLEPGKYEFTDPDWRSLDVNDIWARAGQTVFMRRTVTVPSDWAGLKVGIELMTGGEGLLTVDGVPHHGIDDNRGYVLLFPEANGGERFQLEAEMRTGGHNEFMSGDLTKPFLLSEARLIGIDRTIEAAWYDFRAAWDVGEAFAEGSLMHEKIMLTIREALFTVDMRDHSAPGFGEALASASKVLREKLDAIEFGASAGRIFFTGHSHIDVAWLWPLRETMRKTGRTFSTVAALMDEFPDYYFNCSQVPLFLYLKEHYPAVYERVLDRIKEGRFEPVGGTWVEHDGNVPSGESMVRQCLYGQRFFRNELGCDVRVGWLPDVFGYSWAIPQIYRKAGLEFFMTAKVSWNETNRLPDNTFWWQGVDGTRVLAHLVHNTMSMYGARVTPREMLKVWDDFRPALKTVEVLSPFGHGDGGGGPTREMLEYVPRMANMPGIPKARTGRVDDFFDEVKQTAQDLPVWNNEMYFERHRGTATSQAWIKRDNRRSELLYRDAEMLASFGTLLGGDYPKARLVEGWQAILLNQFHDILPGSSIQLVYDEAKQAFARIFATGNAVRESALDRLAASIDTCGDGEPVVVVNTLSWSRTGVVTLELGERAESVRVIAQDGCEAVSQASGGTLRFVARNVPSCGYAVYRLAPQLPITGELGLPAEAEGMLHSAQHHECLRTAVGDASPSAQHDGRHDEPFSLVIGGWGAPFTVDGEHIVTPFYELTLSADGTLHRLYDRLHEREVLPDGARAEHLQVFEDKPSTAEAWDIDRWYSEKMWEFVPDGPAKVIETGPVRLVLTQTMRYGKSRLERDIVLYAHSPRIDFVNRVDWQERKTLLKVAFPVDIHASRATYEIAFGAIERATHRNTSWDQAQFEVPGHRWADLSEADYGVSVLNDSKYGWDIKDNLIRLTLLRSPESPDPDCDRGVHEFTYSMLPHTGDWRNGTVRAGYELNVPMLAFETEPHEGTLPAARAFVAVDRPNVIVDTVTQAEDSDAWIVRVYEAHGARGPVALGFDRAVASASDCNLLEEADQPLVVEQSIVRFAIKPFEIRTVKVRFD